MRGRGQLHMYVEYSGCSVSLISGYIPVRIHEELEFMICSHISNIRPTVLI